MRSHWQPTCITGASIMEVLSLVLPGIQFVFIVFCNIPQTTESLLLYSVALFIPQE